MPKQFISPTAKLYSNAKVLDSALSDKVIVGDFSRIVRSSLGKYVKIDRNNFVTDSLFGDYTYTGPFDMIFKSEIGRFSSISYGVTIGPPEHNYKRITMHPFIHNVDYGIFSDNESLVRNDKLDLPIKIGNDVWIGANSTILRGVSIGDGAVVGANSLVKHDVPPYSIVVGNPARILKYRFRSEIIEKLLQLQWWNWDIEKIKRNAKLFSSELDDEMLAEL